MRRVLVLPVFACALFLVAGPLGFYAVAAVLWVVTGSGPGLTHIWMNLGIVTLHGWQLWAATGVLLLAGIGLFILGARLLKGDEPGGRATTGGGADDADGTGAP